jgi:hypothetical protein
MSVGDLAEVIATDSGHVSYLRVWEWWIFWYLGHGIVAMSRRYSSVTSGYTGRWIRG